MKPALTFLRRLCFVIGLLVLGLAVNGWLFCLWSGCSLSVTTEAPAVSTPAPARLSGRGWRDGPAL